MEFVKLLITIITMLTLVSCQEELIYSPFETSTNGMHRYLSSVEEVDFSSNGLVQTETTNILFSKPTYNPAGQLVNAYINFTGEDANHSYEYSEDVIKLHLFRASGERRERVYSLKKGLIVSCSESVIGAEESSQYNYSYDSEAHLSAINISRRDLACNVTINWYNENIMSVKVNYGNGAPSIYSYEYSKDSKYISAIPSFWMSSFEIGGLNGVDEILVCQHYFGKMMSKDLISKVFYNGALSREFDYELDDLGYIHKVKEINSKRDKVYRIYTLSWR